MKNGRYVVSMTRTVMIAIGIMCREQEEEEKNRNEKKKRNVDYYLCSDVVIYVLSLLYNM